MNSFFKFIQEIHLWISLATSSWIYLRKLIPVILSRNPALKFKSKKDGFSAFLEIPIWIPAEIFSRKYFRHSSKDSDSGTLEGMPEKSSEGILTRHPG